MCHLVALQLQACGLGNAESGVVPADRPVSILGIEVGRLAEEAGVVLQGHEAVCKALGDPQLLAVVGTQFLGHPLAEGGRAIKTRSRSQICALAHNRQHPHQLALRVRRQLVVPAAQHAGRLARQVLVLLVLANTARYWRSVRFKAPRWMITKR